jgi:hypothetical protein
MSDICREDIIKLCQMALRNKIYWNQVGFDHIAKDYGQGSGTTCGFLPHWLLWRLGCNDPGLVNRSSPGQGLRWRTGDNLAIFTRHRSSVVVDGALAKIMAGVKPDPAKNGDKNQDVRDALAAGKRGPRPGEFVIIRGANWMNDKTHQRDRDSAHIFVLLDILRADGKQVEWRVAQTGIGAYNVSNGHIMQGGEITTLKGKLTDGDFQEGPEANKPKQGPHLVFKADIRGEEPDFPRRVTTFTNLDQVSFGLAPDKDFTDLFEKHWSEQTTNEWMTIVQWLGWYEEVNTGGFIGMAPAYLVLERGHEATRFTRVGAGGFGGYRMETRGAWTLDGNRLEIEWAKPPGRMASGGIADAMGWSQAWSVARVFVPRQANIGTPLTKTAGSLTSLKKMPPEVPPEWAATHFVGA